MAQPDAGPGGAIHAPDAPQGGLGRKLRDIILGGQDGLVNVLGELSRSTREALGRSISTRSGSSSVLAAT